MHFSFLVSGINPYRKLKNVNSWGMFCLARKVRCRTAASMAEMKQHTPPLQLAHWEAVIKGHSISICSH